MTTATILTDLYNITYSSTSHTKRQIFQLPPNEEFIDFTDFPLVVVESGDEEDEPQATKYTKIMFRPTIHFYAEDETAANMETWRESIRTAIMNDTTLRDDTLSVKVENIEVKLSETRKLQHLIFRLAIEFDQTYT